MKTALSLFAVLLCACAVQAETIRVYDVNGRYLYSRERQPQRSYRPRNGNLRYIQSCPDGKCGIGFQGASPAPEIGAPDDQDITVFRFRRSR